ncbi:MULTISPECIES: hypothetical protein [Psychrobacter]|uniref:hypothetical protein n=1 Tax=Psychrobacter TaxID=497 RepID=UPI00191AD008|nr:MULTISPECIES: hypothetical protein [Psychrobacter]
MQNIWVKRLLTVIVRGTSIAAVAAVASAFSVSVQAATMNESLVQNYSAAMKAAANSKNLSQVSRLVSDDALISLSRKGKSTSLDKEAYLRLLQTGWNQTSNYRYEISINNIVITGEQAKANVTTTESWVKDGQSVSFVTNSRVTLTVATGNAVLLRAVSQVTID